MSRDVLIARFHALGLLPVIGTRKQADDADIVEDYLTARGAQRLAEANAELLEQVAREHARMSD